MKECPICKSQSINIYTKVNRWQINSCANCGVLYTDIVNNKKAINKDFYGNKYIFAYGSREQELKNRFKQFLNRIEKYKRGGKLLDIGCGLGYFIYVANRQGDYTWKVTGLELNKELIHYANSSIRSQIINGTMSKLPLGNNQYDCVTCFDVLEHDFHLQHNISEVRRVLIKDGIFVVQAPNYKCLMTLLTGNQWDWWAPPDHVLHFSFKFLLTLLKENNFEILEAYTYEPTKDFLLNINVKFRKNLITKLLFYLTVPLLVILERFSWLFNYGALSIVIAKKK